MALRIKVQICFYPYFNRFNSRNVIEIGSSALCLRMYKSFIKGIKEIGIKLHGTNGTNYPASRRIYKYLLDLFHGSIYIHSSPG